MALYSKIADALGEPVSRRGRASDEIFDRIVELMRASKRPVLLVLDEIVDFIQNKKNRPFRGPHEFNNTIKNFIGGATPPGNRFFQRIRYFEYNAIDVP